MDGGVEELQGIAGSDNTHPIQTGNSIGSNQVAKTIEGCLVLRRGLQACLESVTVNGGKIEPDGEPLGYQSATVESNHKSPVTPVQWHFNALACHSSNLIRLKK
jgi:hypothetical protein